MARDGTEWETYENKICTTCGIEKSYDSFSINQYGKNNRILRRPVCIECYSKKKKIPTSVRKQYEIKYPRPEIGTIFHCPVCDKKKEHKSTCSPKHKLQKSQFSDMCIVFLADFS